MSLRDDIIRDAYQAVAAIQEILVAKPKAIVENQPPNWDFLLKPGISAWLTQLQAATTTTLAKLVPVGELPGAAEPLGGAIGGISARLETIELLVNHAKRAKAISTGTMMHAAAQLGAAKESKFYRDYDGALPADMVREHQRDMREWQAHSAHQKSEWNRSADELERTTPNLFVFVEQFAAECRGIRAALLTTSDASRSQPPSEDASRLARKPAPTPFPLCVPSLVECNIAADFTDSGWRYWARTANNQFKEPTGADKAAIRRVLKPWAQGERIAGLKRDDRRRFREWFYQWFAVPDNPDPLGDTKGNPVPQWSKVERPAPSDPILRDAFELRDNDSPTFDANDRRDDDDDGDE